MTEITVSELKTRLEAGEPVAVVDIRESDEYTGWHIYGSRNVPVYNAIGSNRLDLVERGAKDLPADHLVVTVCRVGLRSRTAAAAFRQLGLDAVSLIGGIRGWGAVWTEARIVLESGPDATFLQIRRNGKGCLSYLIGTDGEAVVVDPSVEVSAYLDIAEREGLRVTHVLETHVHADHLSRARELCTITGAELVMPPNDRVTYPYTPIEDGGVLPVGGLSLEAIATPGHTGESTCYLVNGEALLTGDTLFVESVARLSTVTRSDTLQ